ncbi:MAG TPA: hypothetical protein PLO51_04860, partial [Candidatus Micrarchaeota archaeon]|nr:hypothetical protein [Candidatus Micrarchaeota archaeon]
TSTNQIAVYVDGNTSSSSLSYVPVSPPAAGSIRLFTNESSNMTGNVTGYIVENQGNVNVSVNVTSSESAAVFVGGTSPEMAMWSVNKEAGSCITPVAYGSRFALGAAGSLACDKLLFQDSNDTVYTYVTVLVPSDAPVAANSATITYTSTQV